MELINQMCDDEMKAGLLNLAMQIETGTIDFDNVIHYMNECEEFAITLVIFLSRFNDMTRNALDRLYDYSARKHLEICWEK